MNNEKTANTMPRKLTPSEVAETMKTGIVPDKVRIPAAGATLKSLNGVIRNLKRAKMINDQEVKELTALSKKLMERWIGLEIGELK